jgi:imidazolonepropionase-like amidohydrolase
MIKMVEKRSVLYGGTIFTGNTQYTIDKGSIVYENSRIIYVGRDTGYNITAEDVVYDCKDKFIMPGLIDCHVHYGGTESPYAKDWVLEPDEEQAMVSISQAKKSLFNGFTTVRDISDNGIHLRNMINSGIISGPRIIACGRGLSRTGGHGDAYEVPVEKARNSHPWAIICDGEDEIRKGVRRLIKEGSQCIKLWASGGGLWEKERETDQHYSLKEISVMVEEATNAGIPVCAHCECLSSAMDSAIAGVVSIEHGEELNEEVLAIMKTKDISLVPTYGLFMEWFSEYDPPPTRIAVQISRSDFT